MSTQDVATRPEVYFLLARYATKNDQLSLDDLRLFLETEQGGEIFAVLSIVKKFAHLDFVGV